MSAGKSAPPLQTGLRRSERKWHCKECERVTSRSIIPFLIAGRITDEQLFQSNALLMVPCTNDPTLPCMPSVSCRSIPYIYVYSYPLSCHYSLLNINLHSTFIDCSTAHHADVFMFCKYLNVSPTVRGTRTSAVSTLFSLHIT